MPNSLNNIMSFSVGSPSLPGQQRRDYQCYNQRSFLAVKCSAAEALRRWW